MCVVVSVCCNALCKNGKTVALDLSHSCVYLLLICLIEVLQIFKIKPGRTRLVMSLNLVRKKIVSAEKQREAQSLG